MTFLLTVFQLTALFELFWLFLFLLPSDPNLSAKLITSSTDPKNLLAQTGDPGSTCKVSSSCGTCRNLTKVGGVIESVNFPDEYESNLNCLFTINGPPDSKIQLNFTEFVVENCCDFITVLDGEIEPLEIGLNGYTIPKVITSSSNKMTLKFTTNSDNSMIEPQSLGPARWQAIYTFLATKPNIRKNMISKVRG